MSPKPIKRLEIFGGIVALEAQRTGLRKNLARFFGRIATYGDERDSERQLQLDLLAGALGVSEQRASASSAFLK